MAIYYKKFKNSIKNEFMQYRADSRNLKNFIRIFIKLNDKIFLRLMEKWDIKPKYDRTGFAYWNYF